MRRWIITVAVLLVAVIVVWLGSAVWSGVQEGDELQAYATEMETVGTRMEQVGQTLESLAQTNPFSWSSDQQAQWQAIRVTVKETGDTAESVDAPAFLAEAHGHAVEALKTYTSALTDLDTIIKGGAENAQQDNLESIIVRIDTANEEIDAYLKRVEEALTERYGAEEEESSVVVP